MNSKIQLICGISVYEYISLCLKVKKGFLSETYHYYQPIPIFMIIDIYVYYLEKL
jgi:hypothetical protein